MKLKRLLSLGFATVLTVGVLTSCGNSRDHLGSQFGGHFRLQ